MRAGKKSRSEAAYGDAARVVQRKAVGKGTRSSKRYAGVVQRRGGKPVDPEAVRDTAARGVAGGGGALPFSDTIQASFGRHDIGGVRAHVGGDAAAASEAIGARAYATGDSVAFQQAPDLFTAAHEAAHVVQQREGVQLKGGVGEVGDAYERHADAVAGLVVAGQSAESLLDEMAPGGGASPVQRTAVQMEAIDVAGGTFDVDPYEPWDGDPGNDTDKRAGLKLEVNYTPATDVVSNKIGFVQVMKCIKGDASPLLFDNEKARATTDEDGEAGWAVDRAEGKKHGNYGRDNDGSESGADSNMTFGSRTDASTHVNAWMYDRTNLPRKAGATFTCDAHLYAVDIQHAEYLGAIKWGYKISEAGAVTANPLVKSSEGAPTGFQRRAVEKWNEQADLDDDDKKNHADQVKLPLPGRKKTNTAGVWLVSNPSKYKETIIVKLETGTILELEGDGSEKKFNQTSDKYKWVKVQVAEGGNKGLAGWVMQYNLDDE